MHVAILVPLPVYPTNSVIAICIAVGGCTPSRDHLTQLVFLGEFPAQGCKIADNVLAGVHQSLLRGNIAIGLDAKLELSKERMRD